MVLKGGQLGPSIFNQGSLLLLLFIYLFRLYRGILADRRNGQRKARAKMLNWELSRVSEFFFFFLKQVLLAWSPQEWHFWLCLLVEDGQRNSQNGLAVSSPLRACPLENQMKDRHAMVKHGQGQSEVWSDVTRPGIYGTPALPNSDSRRRKALSHSPFKNSSHCSQTWSCWQPKFFGSLIKRKKTRRFLGLCSKPLTWNICGEAQESTFIGRIQWFRLIFHRGHSNSTFKRWLWCRPDPHF